MSEAGATHTEPAAEADKPQKHRSPSYPAFDLKTAIGRAREVRTIAGTHPASMATAIKAWGYKPKSSNGILTVAALKKYGLTSDSGRGDTRKIQLTRLGQEILFFGEETGEWLERVRRAALTPKIYREIWANYGPDLPDDEVMLHDLIFERGFSEAAARDVLRQFRATAAYTRLAEAGAMLAPDEGENDSEDDSDEGPILTPPAALKEPPAATPKTPEDPGGAGETKRSQKTINVTYSTDEWALLQAKFPMSEDDWDAMIEVLQAMKRGLVRRNA
jgi:hypothetical protein